MIKILALSTNYPYHQDLLASLKDKGIVAEFATSHDVENEMEKCHFYKTNKTKLINGKDFYIISKFQKVLSADAPVLDEKIIKYFESVERDFYTISDRYAYFPKSFRERKRLFRMGIRYWLWFFKQNNIDAVFSICSPHNFPDYTAFFVAQYLGIKTFITMDVSINNHVMIMQDYRQKNTLPSHFLEDYTSERILNLINPSFLNDALEESKLITFSKALNDKQIGVSNLNQTIVKKVKISEKEKSFLDRAKKYLSPEILKPKFKAPFAMNGEFTDFSRRLIRARCGLRLYRTKKAYNKLAIHADLSKKYVYFAMHLTPERTIQPEAEVFEDHLLAIEILANSVPKDWLIYVKENPSQNGRKQNLVLGRHYLDQSDYLGFIRLPNVKLIRQDVKTADLINNATIVSTLKGSVGWEAINAGKACVIFSNAWYSACKSAYRVNDIESCKKAIKEVIEKKPEDVNLDKLRFFAYMQEYIVIGSMGGHLNVEMASVPYKELVESLAISLKKFISK